MHYIGFMTHFELSYMQIALCLLVFTGLGVPLIMLIRRVRKDRTSTRELISSLTSRARIVDHLLDFSQTLQGAGRPEQVLKSLSQFLETELNLSGVAVVEYDPDRPGGPQVKCTSPPTLISAGENVADLDDSACPCIRQNLPRHFNGVTAPVRCAIDTCIALPPSNPAYCIPMQIGAKTRILLHMLLPPTEQWTESRRQLAQTYANTAQSALVTLHLLAEAEQRTMTDPLTGLYNRRSMESLMEREVALAERHQRPLSLVMIDLDYFKNINDTHGHAAGDHLLRSFADCVRITLRKTDLAFRYGGDEFVIALPQTPIGQAQQVVQKLRQAFAAVDFSSAITNLDQQPTLSIGLAERSVAWNVLSLSALISAADQALYDAKGANPDFKQ
jgi:diguanylate cyclase (GGDEF)-like protein